MLFDNFLLFYIIDNNKLSCAARLRTRCTNYAINNPSDKKRRMHMSDKPVKKIGLWNIVGLGLV